jgi:hypothetical protein
VFLRSVLNRNDTALQISDKPEQWIGETSRNEDPRVVISGTAENEGERTDLETFERGLSDRSLALDYQQWLLGCGGKLKDGKPAKNQQTHLSVRRWISVKGFSRPKRIERAVWRGHNYLGFESNSKSAAGVSLFAILNSRKFRELHDKERKDSATEIDSDVCFDKIQKSMGHFSKAMETCQSAFHSKHGIVVGSPKPYWKIAGQLLQDSGKSGHSLSPTLCAPEPCGNMGGQLAQDSEQSTSSFNPTLDTLEPCGNVDGQLSQDFGQSGSSFSPTGPPRCQPNGFGIAAHQPSGTPDHQLNELMGNMLND